MNSFIILPKLSPKVASRWNSIFQQINAFTSQNRTGILNFLGQVGRLNFVAVMYLIGQGGLNSTYFTYEDRAGRVA